MTTPTTCACPFKGRRQTHYEWCEKRAYNRRAVTAERVQRPPVPTLVRVRAVIARAAGVPTRRVRVAWLERPAWTQFPTGVYAWRGKVRAEAEGYRTADMIVIADADSVMIR